MPGLPAMVDLTDDDKQKLCVALKRALATYISKKTGEGMFFSRSHYIIHDAIINSIKSFHGIKDTKTTPNNLVNIFKDIIQTLELQTTIINQEKCSE
jgi:hypothetical protein